MITFLVSIYHQCFRGAVVENCGKKWLKTVDTFLPHFQEHFIEIFIFLENWSPDFWCPPGVKRFSKTVL